MQRPSLVHRHPASRRLPITAATLAALGVLVAPAGAATAQPIGARPTAARPAAPADATSPTVTGRPATIAGHLWLDLDGDGRRAAAEPAAAELEVRLLDAGSSRVLATQRTSKSGEYRFAELVPAAYVLEVRLPEGRGWSPRDAGSDDRLDSDFAPESGRSERLELAPGSLVEHLDGGLRVVPIFVEGFETGDLSRWSTGAP